MYGIKIKDFDIPLAEPVNGRFAYTFMPDKPDDKITLVHDGAIGDYHFNQVQIERGNQFTDYAENTSEESMLGAAFRYITELTSYVTDENGDMTRMTKETLRSTLTVYQDIINGTSNETLESDEGLYRVIQNALTGDFHRMVMTDDTFALEVGNIADNSATAKLQVNNDNLALGLFGSKGMISGIGVVDDSAYIKAEHIFLDGEVLMSTAFVERMNALYLFAEELSASRATFGSIIAQNIDVNNISGNRMRFITGIFNGVTTDLYIDGWGIKIDSHSRWDLDIDYRGLAISSRHGRGTMALLQGFNENGIEKGMAFIAENGFELRLGGRRSYNAGTNIFDSSISIAGTSGRIHIHNDLMVGKTNYGLRLTYGTITGNGTGVKLAGVGVTGYLYIMNNDVWWSGPSGNARSLNSLFNRVTALESKI